MNPTLLTFFALVKEQDGEALEAARDLVRPEHFAPLVEHYWQQSDWYGKAAVIGLVQDTLSPITLPIMRDFLHAPADTRGDWLDITKVIALCHLEGNLGLFDQYYGHPALIAERVQVHVGQQAAVPTPLPTRIRISRSGKVTVGALLFLLLLFGGLGGLAWQEQSRYARDGVRVTAGVVHMEEFTWAEADRRYQVVYLFDAGGLDFVTDSDYVTAAEWEHAQATKEIEVLFLPSDPELNTAAGALDRQWWGWMAVSFGVPVLFAVVALFTLAAEYLSLAGRIRWRPKQFSLLERL